MIRKVGNGKIQRRKNRGQFYSYIVFALGCLAIAVFAIYSSTELGAAGKLQIRAVKPSAQTIEKARNLVQNNFDLDQERELTETFGRHSVAPAADAVTIEILKANKTNLDRLFAGQKINVSLKNSADPLTADIQQAWATIEKSLKGLKTYNRGGVVQFKQALENYEKGMSLKQFPADDRGDIYLKEASYKFMQILKSQPIPIVKEYSMYFLGDIGFNLWDEGQDLPGAVYMIEVVRSTEDHELAQKAWLKLSAQVHFGYTGSAGDNTPQTWKRFLAQLQGLTTKDQNFPLMSRLE